MKKKGKMLTNNLSKCKQQKKLSTGVNIPTIDALAPTLTAKLVRINPK